MTHRRRAIKRALSTAAACGLVAATLATLSTPAQAVPTRAVFTQSTPIYLGDNDYEVGDPTDFEITGVPGLSPDLEVGHAGVVDSVEVTVVFGDTYASDVEMLLVGPQGQAVVLLNGVGGTDPLEEAYLTFTMEGGLLEQDSSLAGTHLQVRPASFGPLALAQPSGPSVGTDLAVFQGTRAAGNWQLHVINANGLGTGQVRDWALNLGLATATYPSELEVSGMGSVTDVNVTLDGLDAPVPEDVDLMLVGPHGQRAMVLSDAAGDADVEDLDLTFDDQAAERIPSHPEASVVSGRYQPSTYGLQDEFPALGDLVDAPSSLSVFDDTDPNGTWRLYAVDDAAGSPVTVQGWSLDIEALDLTAPSGTVSVAGGAAYATSTAVDLSLTAADSGPGASGVQQMRFSNDGATWSAFQPYAATAPWTLAPGRDGSRRVFAQFRDGTGNLSPVVSDTITLDTRGPRVIKVKPRRDRSGVQPDARVKVVTTEALAKATVTSSTVFLTTNGGSTITATLRVRAAKIILEPTKPLKPGIYRATVTTGVTDLAGNAFDAKKKAGTQPLRWTFTV